MTGIRMLSLATAAALGVGAAHGALAGSATLSSADGGSASFEYNATMLRMGAPDADGYSVLRDGKLYVVSTAGGEPMVIDAGAMLASFGDMGQQMGTDAAPDELSGEFLGLKATGRKETVAGVPGEVYTLSFRDDTGAEQSEEIVLSDDARAKEFRDALALMLSVVASMTASGETPQAGETIQAQLKKIDKGILRFGDQMRVTEIDDRRIDDSRFELPAEPMQMDGFADMLGAMGAQGAPAQGGAEDEGSGGVLSGMMGVFGRQADRQAERVGDSVEQEIDEEADERVDKALGKAFGKLFKR